MYAVIKKFISICILCKCCAEFESGIYNYTNRREGQLIDVQPKRNKE